MRESIVRLTRAGRAILAADGPVSEGHR
jgi:hypothetical protein